MMAAVSFAHVASRLERESWSSPSELAGEMYIMMALQGIQGAFRLMREDWKNPNDLAIEAANVFTTSGALSGAKANRMVREDWPNTKMLADELFVTLVLS